MFMCMCTFIKGIDYMKEKHHWIFPLHSNYLQHLYLILCNDVDCKVMEIKKRIW
jgi:hypothetical protein